MSCYGGELSPGPVVQATCGALTGESAFSCQQKVWKDLFIVSCDVPSPPSSTPRRHFLTPDAHVSQFKRTKKWQPLFESNDLGYISTQEHVTPHIGITARFFGFNNAHDEEAWGSRKLDKPPYRNR